MLPSNSELTNLQFSFDVLPEQSWIIFINQSNASFIFFFSLFSNAFTLILYFNISDKSGITTMLFVFTRTSMIQLHSPYDFFSEPFRFYDMVTSIFYFRNNFSIILVISSFKYNQQSSALFLHNSFTFKFFK